MLTVCSLTAHSADIILIFLHQPGEGGKWEHVSRFSEFSLLGSGSGKARCTHPQATCSASQEQTCCSRRGKHQPRSAVLCARGAGKSVTDGAATPFTNEQLGGTTGPAVAPGLRPAPVTQMGPWFLLWWCCHCFHFSFSFLFIFFEFSGDFSEWVSFPWEKGIYLPLSREI